MRGFLLSGAALVLGLAFAGAVQADGSRPGNGGHNDRRSYDVRRHDDRYYHHDDRYYRHDDRYYRYDSRGRRSLYWSRRYWDGGYGTYLYWAPTYGVWYYWCEPDGCYYPLDYAPYGRYSW
jgi:hypothetical protein